MGEIQAFQITVSAVKGTAPWQEPYHKYYLERVEPPDEEHLPQELEFIRFATVAFRHDFCIRNKLKPEETITRVEKVTFSSTRRDFN